MYIVFNKVKFFSNLHVIDSQLEITCQENDADHVHFGWFYIIGAPKNCQTIWSKDIFDDHSYTRDDGE